MVLKIALLALFILAFLYVIYRASDYYFTQRSRQDRLEAAKERLRMARDEAIWTDDDPGTFDEDVYEQARRELEREGER